MMLPIAILPAAGLLLGFGGALTNPSTLAAYPFLDIEWLQTILSILSFAGNAVFANLALIFTIGVAVGLANGDNLDSQKIITWLGAQHLRCYIIATASS